MPFNIPERSLHAWLRPSWSSPGSQALGHATKPYECGSSSSSALRPFYSDLSSRATPLWSTFAGTAHAVPLLGIHPGLACWAGPALQLRYLVFASHPERAVVGCLQFFSPAWPGRP